MPGSQDTRAIAKGVCSSGDKTFSGFQGSYAALWASISITVTLLCPMDTNIPESIGDIR